MAITNQVLQVGAITSCRLAYAVMTSLSTSEITSWKRFDATVGDTGEDFVATTGIVPTFAELSESEYSDLLLRGQVKTIRAEKSPNFYKASDGTEIESGDSVDTIAFTVGVSVDQQLKLIDLMRTESAVTFVYPEFRESATGTINAYSYIIGKISAVNISEEDYKTAEITISGSIAFTPISGYAFGDYASNLEFSSVDFYSWGDTVGTGDTCGGLKTAGNLASLYGGTIVTVKI